RVAVARERHVHRAVALGDGPRHGVHELAADDEVFEEVPGVGLLAHDHPSRRRRATTCAWISLAPSKIDRTRASTSRREAVYSSAKPLPPWIWTLPSAASHAARVARSFAMPASRSQRLSSSF